MRVIVAFLIAIVQTYGAVAEEGILVDDFQRPNSLYHGGEWESLTPGFWKLEGNSLRRQFDNTGSQARATGYPFAWKSRFGLTMPVSYDPSLPYGMIWHRDWRLTGDYRIRIELSIHGLPPDTQSQAPRRDHEKGFGLIGVSFGAQTLYESWHGGGSREDACLFAAWRDDGMFGIYSHSSDALVPLSSTAETSAAPMKAKSKAVIELAIHRLDTTSADITATLTVGENTATVTHRETTRTHLSDGYFGLVTRGLLDVAVDSVWIQPLENTRQPAPVNELLVAYPLGNTLTHKNGIWQCTFVCLFRGQGERAQIRIATDQLPEKTWGKVPVAGSAPIVRNGFRVNTAVVVATLPHDPSTTPLYYTVWKDGQDVTADPRDGYLGRKDYVGRLPQLKAPYTVCGLSCHILGHSPRFPQSARFQANWLHNQPSTKSFVSFEDFRFQTLLWEDDIWYLESVLFPASTADAYKIIELTIANPTSRWMMMRHWNVLNPGDHDYGMDDTKGPEQFAIRSSAGLGQDPEYLQRNFQIVQHLCRGTENPSPTDNPKMWRRWTMPNGDFSIVALDARLWRSSQDTRLWVSEGWGEKDAYPRTDPTRTLLGEEQFAWLSETIKTEPSPLILVTGLNALHTIWAGQKIDPETGLRWDQRDRLTADLAGWVQKGAERVIELFGSRSGIVSVYGDVHAAAILTNKEHRFLECTFGPISARNSRGLSEQFGRDMLDYDGREVEVHALFHSSFDTPDLKPLAGGNHYNFVEMTFEPGAADPHVTLAIRNLTDSPSSPARGGGSVAIAISEMGRPPQSRLPAAITLPDADVYVTTIDGRPVRALRSRADGSLPDVGFPDLRPGTKLLIHSHDGADVDAQLLTTVASTAE